jgi:hypothetical protein
VIEVVRDMLTEENQQLIAREISALCKDNPNLKRFQRLIKENNKQKSRPPRFLKGRQSIGRSSKPCVFRNRQSKRKIIIISITIVILLLMIYWKWPRPLSDHFKMEDPPNDGVIFLVDGQHAIKILDLNSKETIAPLWSEIQRTRVLHLNWYKTIDLTNNTLYTVFLRSGQNDGNVGGCSFDCDKAGYVYMNSCKYAVVGHSELIPILEQIFEENDAKLFTN